MKKLIIYLFTVTLFVSCDHYVTRNFGGNSTIKLAHGEKLIESAWKGDGNLGYLVEPMDSNYVPKTKIFKESSMMGMMEGSVIFIETR